MKASPSLLAVLLMLSSTSLAQTAPVQTPVQEMAPTQQAVPTQQTAAGGEASKPEAARPEAESPTSAPLASPTASTASTEAGAATADAVPAVPAASIAPLFAPGAKLFLEPMNGFEQFVSEAIVKRKVPVVVVKESANADFVVSGEAHVKKPGWKGIVLDTGGKGNISIKDARTSNVVFACNFNKVDQGLAEVYIYQGWANACAKHMKKAMEKK
jgi:hypothetical protein